MKAAGACPPNFVVFRFGSSAGRRARGPTSASLQPAVTPGEMPDGRVGPEAVANEATPFRAGSGCVASLSGSSNNGAEEFPENTAGGFNASWQ
jgi:hypothetical protein